MRLNFRKQTFLILHNLLNKKDVKLFYQLKENDQKTYDELKNDQLIQLKKITKFAYENYSYYEILFKKNGITPEDIKNIDDLKYLPITTKTEIRNHFDEFEKIKINGKYIAGSTGGSTGEPLKYRMSETDHALGFGLCYRGWDYGGYEFGDSMLILGGGSIVKTEIIFRKKIYHYLKNHYIASSYGMDDQYLNSLVTLIHKKKIKFIRGYASSVFLLAEYIKNNLLNTRELLGSVKSIFTTSEMLLPQQRKIIEETFGVKVYDGYGLNDGGISAYENGVQNGFLIDTERSILECVNKKDVNVVHEKGKIIATSLYNFHMPFIRYDTGDIGIISDEYLKLGGNRMVLKSLLGRANDFIEINNKRIGTPVLTVLMGKVNAVRYQFIQTSDNSIEIIIEKGELYSKKDEKFIVDSLQKHVGECNINLVYGNNFIDSENKHKFIIRDF